MISLKLFTDNTIGLGNSTIHLHKYIYIVAIGNLIIRWERYGLIEGLTNMRLMEDYANVYQRYVNCEVVTHHLTILSFRE